MYLSPPDQHETACTQCGQTVHSLEHGRPVSQPLSKALLHLLSPFHVLCNCSVCFCPQVDELSNQHRHQLAENAALAECQTLIQEAAKGWGVTSAAARGASRAALLQASQEYMHAATRHLYYQRALLQLLLRQLTFCVSELQGVPAHHSCHFLCLPITTVTSCACPSQLSLPLRCCIDQDIQIRCLQRLGRSGCMSDARLPGRNINFQMPRGRSGGRPGLVLIVLLMML